MLYPLCWYLTFPNPKSLRNLCDFFTSRNIVCVFFTVDGLIEEVKSMTRHAPSNNDHPSYPSSSTVQIKILLNTSGKFMLEALWKVYGSLNRKFKPMSRKSLMHAAIAFTINRVVSQILKMSHISKLISVMFSVRHIR